MERGFIQGKLEIKFLLLFILARAEVPLELDLLGDVAMCDSGVSYFDLSAALLDQGSALPGQMPPLHQQRQRSKPCVQGTPDDLGTLGNKDSLFRGPLIAQLGLGESGEHIQRRGSYIRKFNDLGHRSLL